MGKHKKKRRYDEDDEKLYALFKKFTKRMRYSSSDSEDEDNEENDEIHASTTEYSEKESTEETTTQSELATTIQTSEGESLQIPALDDDILKILGEDPNKKVYAEEIHKDITTRWSHIVTNGLEKESKSELIKKYSVPENCQFLEPPKLNPEIKAAISDQVLKRDKILEQQQNCLGQATACIGKAVDILIKSGIRNKECTEATQVISDAGRILCDLFHTESMSRRHLLKFALNKSTKDIVSNTKVGKYIFGENLAEDLKAGKAINKTGGEIKYNQTQPKPATLNYRGPPRKSQPQQYTPSAGRQPPYNRKNHSKPAPQRGSAPLRRGGPPHRKT